METYTEQKARQQKEVNEFKGIFFAFNNDQFMEGLSVLEITKDAAKTYICSLGAGGYILKSRSKDFSDMFKRHEAERKERKKEEKFLYESLLYELRNHEYCITYDVNDALNALGLSKNDIDEKLLKKACEEALVAERGLVCQN